MAQFIAVRISKLLQVLLHGSEAEQLRVGQHHERGGEEDHDDEVVLPGVARLQHGHPELLEGDSEGVQDEDLGYAHEGDGVAVADHN